MKTVGRPMYLFNEPEGYIYFIQMDRIGPIKIGFTKDIGKRILSLHTSSPYPLRLIHYYGADQEHEKDWHSAFSDIRLEGEWFLPHPFLIKQIEYQIEIDKREEERKAHIVPAEEIEKRTKDQLFGLLHRENVTDYIRAKRIIFAGQWINSKIYDQQIEWICEYLNC